MEILAPYLFKEINHILRIVLLMIGVVYVIIKVSPDQNGNMIKGMRSLTHIRKKIDKECMKYIAYYDELTGLTNKAYLKEQFNKQKGHYEPIACIYLDVDNFKIVNDSFGYEYGDRVLFEIGKRINDIASDEVIVSRIEADEFGILLMGTQTRAEVKHFVQKIEEGFKDTFTINTIKFGISFSIGIAMYPKDGEVFDELLNSADTAMHKAKDKGKRTHIFFNPKFKELTLEKIHMESNLRKAFIDDIIKSYSKNITGTIINLAHELGFEVVAEGVEEEGNLNI